MIYNFLRTLFFKDSIFISASDKIEIGEIKIKTEAKASVIRSTPIDYDNFSNLIDLITDNNFDSFGWLTPIVHLLLAANQEDDPWKHYYLSFSALELLIESKVKENYENLTTRIELKISDENKTVSTFFPFDILKDKKEFNLKDRFGILAFELFPEDANNDYELFLALKKKRDSMSHGRPIEEEQLPIPSIDSLLYKYLKKLISIHDI